MIEKIKDYLGLVKFSHTVFALPFALIGYTMGVLRSEFLWWDIVGVLACMVLARSAAMGFNRYIDRRFDAKNPRTATREIPAGKISPKHALWFVIICSIGFVLVAATFNRLTLFLSPVALVVILGYSLTKRFTSLCHLILGLGLAIAPTAAYIAVTGEFAWEPMVLSFLVWSWVSGFDIIFALQDTDFDKSVGLRSIPVKLGVKGGLVVSSLLHLLTLCSAIYLATLIINGFNANTILIWVGIVLFGALLLYQHLIVKPSDLSRVNIAFGTVNGIASIIYAVCTITALLI